MKKKTKDKATWTIHTFKKKKQQTKQKKNKNADLRGGWENGGDVSLWVYVFEAMILYDGVLLSHCDL